MSATVLRRATAFKGGVHVRERFLAPDGMDDEDGEGLGTALKALPIQGAQHESRYDT